VQTYPAQGNDPILQAEECWGADINTLLGHLGCNKRPFNSGNQPRSFDVEIARRMPNEIAEKLKRLKATGTRREPRAATMMLLKARD
jgi:hypothetical protein